MPKEPKPGSTGNGKPQPTKPHPDKPQTYGLNPPPGINRPRPGARETRTKGT